MPSQPAAAHSIFRTPSSRRLQPRSPVAAAVTASSASSTRTGGATATSRTTPSPWKGSTPWRVTTTPRQNRAHRRTAAASSPATALSMATPTRVQGQRNNKRRAREVDFIVSEDDDDDDYDNNGNGEQIGASLSLTRRTKRVKREGEPEPEKRRRLFRKSAPQSFQVIYERARTHRFFVISRKRGTRNSTDVTDEQYEEVQLAGTTGNIYTVTISREHQCTCPYASRARPQKQCKHMVYVLNRVLHAKHEYVYQLALLSNELQEIFNAAPDPSKDAASSSSSSGGAGDADDQTAMPEKRKPIEGDCPICYIEFEEHEQSPKSPAVVWCTAACGNNFHRKCFRTWATTKCRPGREAEATCPLCRSVWGLDEEQDGVLGGGGPAGKIRTDGPVNAEGYVNVADQLGISGARDTSTYYHGEYIIGGVSYRNRPRG